MRCKINQNNPYLLDLHSSVEIDKFAGCSFSELDLYENYTSRAITLEHGCGYVFVLTFAKA